VYIRLCVLAVCYARGVGSLHASVDLWHLLLQGQGLDAQQLRFLLCGVSLGGTGGHRGGKDQLQSPACPTSSSQRPSTFPEGLLSERQAARASELCALPEFSDLPRQMAEAFSAWRLFLSAPLAEACIPLIGNGSAAEDELAAIWRRLLLLYALRPDRVAAGARAFVSHVLGSSFLGGHSDVDLAQVLECVPPSQNIFLLSSTAGFDTSGRVEALSQARGVAFSVIALGSPEGYETADKAIAAATAKGGWVLLKNVHLAFEWLHILDKRLHRMEPHKGFRLFMTTEMSASVPKGILSCAQVIVYEPPEGVKASLQQSFRGIIAERASGGPVERCRLHLMLSWLHALVLGRIRYCPIGWTKPYEFSETDLRNSADTIDAWVERAAGPGRANLAPEKLPWEAMRELIALCYGGRIDNDFDQRTLRSLLDRFFKSEVYGLEYALVQGARGHVRASAGDDKQDTSALPILVPDGSSHSAFTQWIEALPESQVPGWLGLEADADRQLFMTRGRIMLEGWLHLHSALLAVDAIDEASEEEEEKEEEEEGGAEGRQGPPSASSLHVACMHTQGSMPAWSKQLMQSVERWLSSLPETVAVCKLGDAGGDDAVKLCVGREGALAQEILARVRADLQVRVRGVKARFRAAVPPGLLEFGCSHRSLECRASRARRRLGALRI
jgi:dynein heavy chain 1